MITDQEKPWIFLSVVFGIIVVILAVMLYIERNYTERDLCPVYDCHGYLVADCARVGEQEACTLYWDN